MEHENLEGVVRTLVEEAMRTQAQVAALEYACLALMAASPEATNNLRILAANVDGYTLPVPMSESQRALIKEKIELLIGLSHASQQVCFPGGMRGLKNGLRAGLHAVWRLLFGQAALARRMGQPEPVITNEVREYLKGKGK